jgi:hypothetical protein
MGGIQIHAVHLRCRRAYRIPIRGSPPEESSVQQEGTCESRSRTIRVERPNRRLNRGERESGMLENAGGLTQITAVSWKSEITDPDEVKVFMALDGPKHTWRTFSGIARQTGLSEERVAEILKKYNLKLTRLSEVPSISGKDLVGLIERVGT